MLIPDSKHWDLSPHTPPANTVLHSVKGMTWTILWSQQVLFTQGTAHMIQLQFNHHDTQAEKMKGFMFSEQNAEIDWTSMHIAKMGIIWSGRRWSTFRCSP